MKSFNFSNTFAAARTGARKAKESAVTILNLHGVLTAGDSPERAAILAMLHRTLYQHASDTSDTMNRLMTEVACNGIYGDTKQLLRQALVLERIMEKLLDCVVPFETQHRPTVTAARHCHVVSEVIVIRLLEAEQARRKEKATGSKSRDCRAQSNRGGYEGFSGGSSDPGSGSMSFGDSGW